MAGKKKKPKQAKPPRELTAKQRLFVIEYLVDVNATQAAIRAGYSAKNADKIGSQLLGKSRVAAEIKRMMDERAQAVEITAERVLRELAQLAFANMDDYASWDADTITLTPKRKLTRGQLAAVGEISQTKEGRIRFKLHGKEGPLRDLARHLGLLIDKIAPTDPTGTKEYSGGMLTDEDLADRILSILKYGGKATPGGSSADAAVGATS